MLERGDSIACEFAQRFAFLLGKPEMVDGLLKFARGCHGSDRMRLDILYHLNNLEVVPNSSQLMWIEGRWTEIECVGFEVTDEPNSEGVHAPAIARLAEQTLAALHDDRNEEAERLLLEAIQLEPDMADLQNNLGAAYEGQGRHAEAQQLTREIHERWPDYFFRSYRHGPTLYSGATFFRSRVAAGTTAKATGIASHGVFCLVCCLHPIPHCPKRYQLRRKVVPAVGGPSARPSPAGAIPGATIVYYSTADRGARGEEF